MYYSTVHLEMINQAANPFINFSPTVHCSIQHIAKLRPGGPAINHKVTPDNVVLLTNVGQSTSLQ